MSTQKLAIEVVAAIAAIVDDDSTPWTERRDAVLEECNDESKALLEEFLSWFEAEEVRSDI